MGVCLKVAQDGVGAREKSRSACLVPLGRTGRWDCERAERAALVLVLAGRCAKPDHRASERGPLLLPSVIGKTLSPTIVPGAARTRPTRGRAFGERPNWLS